MDAGGGGGVASTVASLCSGAGGLALAGSVMFPIAEQGIGSATPMRGLSDLILAGSLSHQVPAWTGAIGYAPALGGSFLLIAELLPPRARVVVQATALGLAALVLAFLGWLVPWRTPADLGPALRLGAVGVLLGAVALTLHLALTGRHHEPRRVD